MSNFTDCFVVQDPQTKFVCYCEKLKQLPSSESKDPELYASMEASLSEMEVHMHGNHPYTISDLSHYDVIIRLQRNGVWTGKSVIISTDISNDNQRNLYTRGLLFKDHFFVEMPTCMLDGSTLTGSSFSASKFSASSLSAPTLSLSGLTASDLTMSSFTASRVVVSCLRISSSGITMANFNASNVTISDLTASNLTVSNVTGI